MKIKFIWLILLFNTYSYGQHFQSNLKQHYLVSGESYTTVDENILTKFYFTKKKFVTKTNKYKKSFKNFTRIPTSFGFKVVTLESIYYLFVSNNFIYCIDEYPFVSIVDKISYKLR